MIIIRGQPGGASRDSPAVIEERLRYRRGADPGCYSGVGADAACSGAWSRGLEASPNLEFTVRASMFGKVCLRHSLRFRRASARHTWLRAVGVLPSAWLNAPVTGEVFEGKNDYMRRLSHVSLNTLVWLHFLFRKFAKIFHKPARIQMNT
jgi:hypothetical protein